jgi:8-oxo-dGTP pyrophosphatase MutT (NUDIX family)
MPRDPKLPKWETEREGEIERYAVFGVQRVWRRSPRTGRVGEYQVLHMPRWVNVIALTDDDRVVLVHQYRHGVDALSLEIPGGLVEPDEDPADAAARELLEETGYAGGEPELLGRVLPNPAIQNNFCSMYVIRDARLVAEPDWDDGEHIQVVTAPLAEIPTLVREGHIDHTLVVSAFYYLALRDGRLDGEAR